MIVFVTVTTVCGCLQERCPESRSESGASARGATGSRSSSRPIKLRFCTACRRRPPPSKPEPPDRAKTGGRWNSAKGAQGPPTSCEGVVHPSRRRAGARLAARAEAAHGRQAMVLAAGGHPDRGQVSSPCSPLSPLTLDTLSPSRPHRHRHHRHPRRHPHHRPRQRSPPSSLPAPPPLPPSVPYPCRRHLRHHPPRLRPLPHRHHPFAPRHLPRPLALSPSRPLALPHSRSLPALPPLALSPLTPHPPHPLALSPPSPSSPSRPLAHSPTRPGSVRTPYAR